MSLESLIETIKRNAEETMEERFGWQKESYNTGLEDGYIEFARILLEHLEDTDKETPIRREPLEHLLLTGYPSRPTISVPDCHKWYSLYVVYPSRAVEKLEYEELEKDFELPGHSAYLDHIPNPMAVCMYAAKNNMDICSLSLAAITRRWFNEYHDTEFRVEHSDNYNEC